MTTVKMTIKLMLDSVSKRLIFAEASKDFVDFLISLPSLSIGTVTKLRTSESILGSIGNIATSVANPNGLNLQRNVDRNDIVHPLFCSPLTGEPVTQATAFDTGKQDKFISSDSTGHGYVQNMASYMISDDLSITLISTMSILSMLNKFNVTKLEEWKVKIGTKEALELLKASLESTTVLTDVFLKRKYRKQAELVGSKMEIFVETLTGRIITLFLEPSETTDSLQTKVEDILAIPRKSVRLIYRAKQLGEGQTLADCNVVNKSTIHQVLRLSGC